MVQAGTKLSERHAKDYGSIASVSPARWQDERRVALMERFLKSAETGGRKSPTFYDDEVISFGLQVAKTLNLPIVVSDDFARSLRKTVAIAGAASVAWALSAARAVRATGRGASIVE